MYQTGTHPRSKVVFGSEEECCVVGGRLRGVPWGEYRRLQVYENMDLVHVSA